MRNQVSGSLIFLVLLVLVSCAGKPHEEASADLLRELERLDYLVVKPRAGWTLYHHRDIPISKVLIWYSHSTVEPRAYLASLIPLLARGYGVVLVGLKQLEDVRQIVASIPGVDAWVCGGEGDGLVAARHSAASTALIAGLVLVDDGLSEADAFTGRLRLRTLLITSGESSNGVSPGMVGIEQGTSRWLASLTTEPSSQSVQARAFRQAFALELLVFMDEI